MRSLPGWPQRLPLPQRKKAIVIGGGAAIVLRIALTAIAALFFQIPGLQLVGGLLLIWIAFKLLKAEEESHEGLKAAGSMREAITTILIADFVMSTDNVLVVACQPGRCDAVAVWTGPQHDHSDVVRQPGRHSDQSLLLAFLRRSRSHRLDRSTDDLEDPIVITRAAWINRTVAYASAGLVTIAVTSFAHWFHRVRGSAEE